MEVSKQLLEPLMNEVKNFSSLTEIEDFLNSEKCKKLLIQFQIEMIKNKFGNQDIKYKKKQMKEWEKATPDILNCLSFKLNDFSLRNTYHFYHFPYDYADKSFVREGLNILTYVGEISIKLTKPLNMSPTELLRDSLFTTHSGGGSHTEQEYRFTMFESDFKELKTSFLLDSKKRNAIYSREFFDNNESKVEVLNHFNKEKNKERLLKVFKNTLNSNDFLMINNIIEVKNLFFSDIFNSNNLKKNSDFEEIKTKYLDYLNKANVFFNDQKNIDLIIESRLPKNETTKYENTNVLKQNFRDLKLKINKELFNHESKEEKINIYKNILNFIPTNNNHYKNYYENRPLSRSEAIKNKEFLNYCFKNKNPKFFTEGNLYENIRFYLNEPKINKLTEIQKENNENIILEILNKDIKNTESEMKVIKIIKETVSNILYIPSSTFNIKNSNLIDFLLVNFLKLELMKNKNDDDSMLISFCSHINHYKNFKLDNSQDCFTFLYFLVNYVRTLDAKSGEFQKQPQNDWATQQLKENERKKSIVNKTIEGINENLLMFFEKPISLETLKKKFKL